VHADFLVEGYLLLNVDSRPLVVDYQPTSDINRRYYSREGVTFVRAVGQGLVSRIIIAVGEGWLTVEAHLIQVEGDYLSRTIFRFPLDLGDVVALGPIVRIRTNEVIPAPLPSDAEPRQESPKPGECDGPLPLEQLSEFPKCPAAGEKAEVMRVAVHDGDDRLPHLGFGKLRGEKRACGPFPPGFLNRLRRPFLPVSTTPGPCPDYGDEVDQCEQLSRPAPQRLLLEPQPPAPLSKEAGNGLWSARVLPGRWGLGKAYALSLTPPATLRLSEIGSQQLSCHNT